MKIRPEVLMVPCTMLPLMLADEVTDVPVCATISVGRPTTARKRIENLRLQFTARRGSYQASEVPRIGPRRHQTPNRQSIAVKQRSALVMTHRLVPFERV
jgi:hypothetical protein